MRRGHVELLDVLLVFTICGDLIGDGHHLSLFLGVTLFFFFTVAQMDLQQGYLEMRPAP